MAFLSTLFVFRAAPRKCPPNPYVVLPDRCVFVDQQILKLQEHPESIPTGEMPRHVSLVVDRHLVGIAVPGTRIIVTGISMIHHSQTAKAMGEVAVRHPYIKVHIDTKVRETTLS